MEAVTHVQYFKTISVKEMCPGEMELNRNEAMRMQSLEKLKMRRKKIIKFWREDNYPYSVWASWSTTR
jgi:hypothetical protein